MTLIGPPTVKLICAITFAPEINLDDVFFSLEGAFGLIDGKSDIIEFTHTDYYAAEMGPGLKKLLVSFDHDFQANDLWIAKRTTIDIEQVYMKNGKRRINLDVGYLETSKLVLASTKNFSHRISLNQGIYAEVTMLYADGEFKKLPWTYPDYLEPAFQSFLVLTRGALKQHNH
jgi:hypothetical protein